MITENYAHAKPNKSPHAPLPEGTSGAALVIVANIASTSEKSGTDKAKKLSKFDLQNLASELLPDEKIAQCLRHRAPVNHKKDSPIYHTVEVHRHGNHCHYENLIVCDRVWGCPVCASRISEQRRQAITTALDRTDHKTLLATFTLQHKHDDKLVPMLNAITGAYRKLKSGRLWRDFTREFRWIGDIRAWEVTTGGNGWHPHIHVLMLFPENTDEVTIGQIEQWLKKRWLEVLEREGRTANWKHGCDVRSGKKDIRDYVAKFGKMPEQPEQKKAGWTIEHELTKGQTKQGRREGCSPWELLADYGRGDKNAGFLFQEYYFAFKGRHQLQWSRGLRELLNMEEIEEELLEASESEEDAMIFEIYPVEWRKICYWRKRSEVLRLAATEDLHIVYEFIYNLAAVPE